MSDPIRLREWDRVDDVALTFEQVQALQRLPDEPLQVRPGSRHSVWNLRATSYCGSIRVGDVTILIRPKIPLENVFYMLTAGQTDLKFGASLIGYGEDELMPALARFFDRLLANTLQRGVIKAYKQHEETLVTLRGRIDMPAVVRAGGIPTPIPCRFDEMSIDIPENQILMTAARTLSTYPEVAPSIRQGLRRTAGVLDGVGVADPRQLPVVHLTRLNRYYEPALRLAEVILRSSGVRDREGPLEASTFLIDMNRLFERFVTDQLKRLLAGRLDVKDQVLTDLDVGGKVNMYPDLVFYRRGRPVLVADLKYKLTEDGLGRTGDYYQLLAYSTALGLRNGVLIYAGDDQLATTARVVRAGPDLTVRPLTLSGNPLEVESSLKQLAGDLLNSATSA